MVHHDDENSSKSQLDALYEKYPQLLFDYVDPVENFDRQKVFGPLCLQLEIKDPKYAVALDLVAGEKLYDIIVDNEQTAKMLNDRGQLNGNYIIIPLNKIKSNCIDNETVQEAERLVGKDNVLPALSCVIFEEQLTPAMEYAFGDTFICANMDVANKVAFNPKIQRRVVTLDGAVFNPSGLVSGGSVENKGELLIQIAPLLATLKSFARKNSEALGD